MSDDLNDSSSSSDASEDNEERNGDQVELNEEQKAFLEECEKEFANRYTDKDRDYMQVGFLEVLFCFF